MTRHVNAQERESLGLSLVYGQVREDGYTFLTYYKNRSGGIAENWLSPQAWEKYLLRKARGKKETVKRNSAFSRRVKTFLGCQECGYKKHPDALQFDLVNQTSKFKEISKMYCYSRKALKLEMKKCRVLCANCHAVHSAKQRGIVR